MDLLFRLRNLTYPYFSFLKGWQEYLETLKKQRTIGKQLSNYHKDLLNDEQKQQLKKLKQAAQDKANAMNAFINKPAPGTK